MTTTSAGAYNSAVIYNGEPHDFYMDVIAGTLRHAWYSGGRWHTEVLDPPFYRTGMPPVGADATAIVANGQLHVFYLDQVMNRVRHAVWDGWFWFYETVDGMPAPAGNGRTSVPSATSAAWCSSRAVSTSGTRI